MGRTANGPGRGPVIIPGPSKIQLYGSGDSVSCVLPFSRVGNLILIQARADTTEGNFVLDTGAPGLVLNITYFRSYPASQDANTEQLGITGGSAGGVQTVVKKFTFGAMEHDMVDADMVDLGHIENARGVKILGLLGMEFLKQCEMIVDFEKHLIYLHRIGKAESKTYQHEMLEGKDYRTIPIELVKNRIITTCQLKGRKLKLMIDCAAESNVLDSRLPERLFEGFTISRRVVLTGSGSKKVDALFGDIAGMKIGDADMGSMPVLIANLENTCFSIDDCMDGVLGFDFLSLHKIGFNFVKRKMYIWK